MSMLNVAAWAAVISAGVGAVSAISAGQSQKNASEYQAQVADQNAKLAVRNAGAQEEDQRRRARQFQGRQLAAIGESGAGLSGSTADLFRESLFSSEMDALNIRYEGELGKTSFNNEANASRFNGKVAQNSSYMSAASSLIGGVGSYYGIKSRPKTGGLN